MSKKMTPCEKLGYKVGDRFSVVEKSYMFNVGDVAILQSDDGSSYPFFTNSKVMEEYPNGVACFLADIKPIAKLKPAKQALADAIHQNGGWLIAGDYNYVASNHRGVVKFFHEKPLRNGVNWVGGSCSLAWVDLHQQLPNWHQCVLSRDGYFTAYPERVNVEIGNETKRKVDVEMKSESEMTIGVGDWHERGELPPVGVVCLYVVSDRCSAEVEITAHAKFGLCFVEIGKSGECYVSKTAELHRFRPIRAEREKAIDEMVSLVEPLATYMEFAGAIYDAGMYKEVK